MSLRDQLVPFLAQDRVLTRLFERAAYSCDASFYTLTPRAVVRPRDTDEVRRLLAWSRRSKVPLTFRAAGTSLSGQAVTDGVLVDVSRHWRALQVLEGGKAVRVGPGVVGGFVNAHLARFGAKLGPDPASINACMIGGIVSNNSSGMCCGTERNAYRTLRSLRFMLTSGTLIDSGAPDAEATLRKKEPALASGLMRIKTRIEGDARLGDRIRAKYRMKNTMGYSLNAFLDFDNPLPILWHLLVGSEGTLAFIEEATFETVPDLPRKSAGLMFFENVPRACEAIEPLKTSGAVALEIMDRASLRSVVGIPSVVDLVAPLPASAAAILVEYQAADEKGLADFETAFTSVTLPLLSPARLTRDAKGQADLWAARKGLTASIGAMRPSGTSMIFEDVAFPHEHLAAGVIDLQALFVKHDYPDAIVFGHAKDGNIHFLLSQSFNDQRSIDQYARFTDDLVDMVVGRYDGALKAEHGTGRNMAPFVEREWGSDLYAIMREIKHLFDPDGILNPGVLMNDNPRIHLENLKALPKVEDEIDRCIECGFCEPLCPSRDLTVTPRQRIVLRRERARLLAAGDSKGARALEEGLDYAVLDTCAADGMCATACPVGIDTGAFVKHRRAERHGALASALATTLAKNFGATESIARIAGRAPQLPRTSREGAAAVYLPSCVTRVLGGDLPATVLRVAKRAGLSLWIPPDVHGRCCGMAFSSKGYDAARENRVGDMHAKLERWTNGGTLPVVIDTSPCAYSLKNDGVRVIDSVAYAHEVVCPRLTIKKKLGRVAVHPVCSIVKLGLAGTLASVVRACAEEAIVPIAAGCCGFAGDRGFTHPELTEAATAREAAELRAAGPFDMAVSSSRTCEIGMERATHLPFVSVWHLLDRVTS
ncbi:MAG TPA: FAD-binding and (Fe-S)-binding domain-containing protein [Candidatus Polarisedimenticolaceae bacterium]|nr:FAD-binding and (Fe-S)-binding domain-containing protein [Candidatus Polarisedimenticolaceae bacterium]